MGFVESLKKAGKKVIGYPERPVPVVSSMDFVRGLSKNPKQDAINYLRNLFPFLQWITRYNLGWLTGDVIAGITVGLVLVPQGMSYAQIATLPVQYGLYSSFVGVFVYCFFATSKDVSIGPVAVMSLETATIISHVQAAYGNRWSNNEIATTLAFMSGFIVLGIGLLRLGWLVEFIPAPAVSGFMTGSALNIAAGQLPQLFGVQNYFDTRAATYQVVINTLKYLHLSTLDAAWGVPALAFLYFTRWLLKHLAERHPRVRRAAFFMTNLRNGFVVIILTLAAWLYCRTRLSKSGKYPISILLTVPRGFQNVGQPHIDPALLSALGSELPVATIILLLEHIAIAKSFGRVNGYKINPNQELIAIGVTNTVGSCFNAYPSTGSFSRSALKAKSGVRTPAAGWFTGIVVIVALYGLTDAFFWIPKAALSAVIIHAVMDLVANPQQVFQFWRVSPLEFFIWAAAVLVTVFSSIENGIYTAIAASAALLLVRIARPRGHFLGRVTVRADPFATPEASIANGKESSAPGIVREVWVPIDRESHIMNPTLKVEPPPPGIIIFRFEESFTYPNSSRINSIIVDHAKETTRRGLDQANIRLADRPWNDPGPRRGEPDPAVLDAKKPLLKAVVLDFSAVSQIDTTAVQSLVDLRRELEHWVDAPVEFHFAGILSPWIRRALIAGGFGTGTPGRSLPIEIAPVVPPSDDRAWGPGDEFPARQGGHREDLEALATDADSGLEKDPNALAGASTTDFEAPIVSTMTPFFHFDLSTAVRSVQGHSLPEPPEVIGEGASAN
ncbi:high affinity sulfate permease [Dacryopinax primogenitus]|uniref:High affinity sulfate permease n=1 Tax=Dacryopinax primogenitus (strain DJM 731) TaxID=1858805 RepID=M5FP51_DACPD|nr:high affinity sulfate permease [Dacryopinax primogenitus]EJT96818.1 high affinity sulfate permease [Dacryopinax primogenitus]